jgi:hypothetical protein
MLFEELQIDIPLKAAFEGVKRVALELPQDKCSGSFGKDRLDL